MDFRLSEEQDMIVKTTRDFVVNEIYPHEAEIEETGVLRHELRDEIKHKAIEAGLYAANMPAEVGGAGLDTLTWVLYEKELGKANYAEEAARLGIVARLEHARSTLESVRAPGYLKMLAGSIGAQPLQALTHQP